MGIRVHKIVGYGTNNFDAPEDFGDRIETLCEVEYDQFLSWIKEHKAQILKFYPENPRSEKRFDADLALLEMTDTRNKPYRCVSFDDEFGFEKTLVVSPLLYLQDCKRYDNLIDWLEEESDTRCKQLTKGIYPYDRGVLPLSVIAVCLFLGIEEVLPELTEMLYVYWA